MLRSGSSGAETAILSGGVSVGEQIVALGAHLLHEGQRVRIAPRIRRHCHDPLQSLRARRPRASVTLFLLIAITMAGIYAFLQLGRAEDPAYTVKVLTVTAAWPGATAEEMQNLVAEPLEKRLQELRWYDRVETFTRPGSGLPETIFAGQEHRLGGAGGVLPGAEETR